MSELLQLREVTKVFSLGGGLSRIKITAVDRVSFVVRRSEVFGLAGESGCGKTTTARMILGFEEPTSGEILYFRNGEGIAPLSPRTRFGIGGIQAVFQNPFESFNSLRPVERYFFETLRNYGLAKNKKEALQMVEEALQAVGLSHQEFSGRYPSEFSGGQLQRISIARALLTRPSLLIADEPVSMVDASLRMSIVNLFHRLREELKVSVIYITHDLATAYYVCDRIAVMFRGNVVEMGDVEAVLMEPKHPYTRLLRESIPEADPEKRWTNRVEIVETEQEEYLRRGCKFAGRCPHRLERCMREVPPDLNVGGVLVKCFLYQDAVTTDSASKEADAATI
ncbi:MAG: ABC transporter ATP-binding protein [Candidatus Bipolaricaulis sp.]|nr:ABC transporter ATP-binding protein [Candidatus Bipolaricaulis sp.]